MYLHPIAMATGMGWLSVGYIHNNYMRDYLMGSRIYANNVNWLPDHHGQRGIKYIVIAHGLGPPLYKI